MRDVNDGHTTDAADVRLGYRTCMNCGQSRPYLEDGWCSDCFESHPEPTSEVSSEKVWEPAAFLIRRPDPAPAHMAVTQADMAGWMGEFVRRHLGDEMYPPVALYSLTRRAAHHGRLALESVSTQVA